MERKCRRLRLVTLLCLYAGAGSLALQIFGAAPLFAFSGPGPVERTLSICTGLLFCVALTTASLSVVLSRRSAVPLTES